jgi:hypothetical protein
MPPYPDYPAWQGIPGAGQGIQCFPFATGWLVRGMGGGVIYVPDPDQIGGIGAGTTAILAAIANLQQELHRMSGTVTNLDQAIASLTAQVTAQTDVDTAAMTMIQGIPAMIAAAVASAQQAGATPAQLQAITDLGAKLDAASGPLSAAVTANTPAA